MIKPLTPAQLAALRVALAHVGGCVYAGENPGTRKTVNAQTIYALGRAGFLQVDRTTAGETVGHITMAGTAAALLAARAAGLEGQP